MIILKKYGARNEKKAQTQTSSKKNRPRERKRQKSHPKVEPKYEFNDILLRQLDVLELDYQKNEIFFTFVYQSIAGWHKSGTVVKITETDLMAEEIISEAVEVGPITAYLKYDIPDVPFRLGNRDEIMPLLREFIESFIKGKSQELTDEEHRILATDGIDFYNSENSLFKKPINQKVNILIRRAEEDIEDGYYAPAKDLMKRALKLDKLSSKANALLREMPW